MDSGAEPDKPGARASSARDVTWPPGVLWIARLAVGLVCFSNLTAAVPLVVDPAGHAASFEVSGLGGEVLVRGLGVAFLMWQVPFLPVIWHPGRHRTCFLCLLGMQVVGLIGESLMMVALPAGHPALRATGLRFIAFDGAGLVGMGLAFLLLERRTSSQRLDV